MPVSEIGDPRLQELFGVSVPEDASVRPIVRLARKGLPPIAIGTAAVILALLLFLVLNERRTRNEEPAVRSQATDGAAGAWAAPPPLYVPRGPQPVGVPETVQENPAPLAAPTPAAAPAGRTFAPPAPAPMPAQPVAPMPLHRAEPPERVSSGSPLVIDTGSAAATSAPVEPGASLAEGRSARQVVRMRASAFANRSMTVPEGYLIPAVLETGFDSTKPGFARAVVSRDVRGFDGKYVLIPRGSRLIGEYRSTVSQGQSRAIINWTRLIRPDGMTISIDSPAVDPLGRGGVAASVNTHFFARLGDALLQTSFGIGSLLAQRSVSGSVVVLPESAAGTGGQIASTNNYTPTLKVAPGKSISVFVAHDLDFSGAGIRQ